MSDSKKRKLWIKHDKTVVAHAAGLVIMIGGSGSGKSTAANAIFGKNAVVSSDVMRELVSGSSTTGDSNDVTFSIMREVVRARLKRRLLTVVDSTNVREEDRQSWAELADSECAPLYAVIVDTPARVCVDRAIVKGVPGWVAKNHHRTLMDDYYKIVNSRLFAGVSTISGERPAPEARILKNRTDARDVDRPFDIIGDVHGCLGQLQALLAELGYAPDMSHPDGRMPVFLGDLMDRGPDCAGVIDAVSAAVKAGLAMAVPGNHDINLAAAVTGSRKAHGETRHSIEQLLATRGKDWLAAAARFFNSLPGHLCLAGGKLVACHAGLPLAYHLADHKRARSIAAYGPWQGAEDEYGFKETDGWQYDYNGDAVVVYGHTVYASPAVCGNTIGIDTGAVFGGRLTALRYPEMTYVSVPGHKYAELGRPPMDSPAGVQRDSWSPGKTRTIPARHGYTVRIGRDQVASAFEARFRLGCDMANLFYVPGTMTPCESAPEGTESLERPQEALEYYARQGVKRLVAQEKHMGSRAVVIIGAGCRGRLGTNGGILTRYGRNFFGDRELEARILGRMEASLSAGGFWEAIDADWAVLDCELMPWSAKAPGLLAEQYVSTSLAGEAGLRSAVISAEQALSRTPDNEQLQKLLAKLRTRYSNIAMFKKAYSQYCWPTNGADGLAIAPFAMLSAGQRCTFDMTYSDLERKLAPAVAASNGILRHTRSVYIDMDDKSTVDAAVAWWAELTAAGGEGAVFKPDRLLVKNEYGKAVLPGVKVRGREYLRIIYGPDYTECIDVLRNRQTKRKARQAMSQYLLGLEGVARMVDGESRARYNEPAFGVIALNSDDIDPRL